jgi:uncharacterized protein involved in response to NO
VPRYRVVRPFWALYLLIVCCLGHGALDLAGLTRWTWLFDVPAALTAIGLTLVWRLDQVLAVRMVALLHVAFAWLGLSFGLYGAQSLLLVSGPDTLGNAPLHALAIGFLASTLLGMATRVTLGHSGGRVDTDSATWKLFWVLQGVAVVRVAAEFVPSSGAASLSLGAALGWVAAFGIWFAMYARSYLRPRSDGKPG